MSTQFRRAGEWTHCRVVHSYTYFHIVEYTWSGVTYQLRVARHLVVMR